MGKSLVIVESPSKATIINRYLGDDYIVKASVGHIRDLPAGGTTEKKKTTVRARSKEAKQSALASRMGVDPYNDWAAHYEIMPGKERVVSELKKLAKTSDKVYLATDLDREGEAIAWHLKEVLGGDDDKYLRVKYPEITKAAIHKAFENPGRINMDLVNAQQTRRFLDRVVGFMVSPLLWKKVARGLSAGRVQSVAVELIVDREREIKAFIPQEYWTVDAYTKTPKKEDLKLSLANYLGKKCVIENRDKANEICSYLQNGTYVVNKIEKRPGKLSANPPFTTSTLQQAANQRLGFSVRRTMTVAQRLYERGLITYMRTDSVNLSNEAIQSAREIIEKEYGSKYVPEKPNYYKSKESAQEAHEAIRPSHPKDPLPSDIDRDGQRLFALIMARYLASQMPPQTYESTSVSVVCGDYELKASGRHIIFDGFRRVWNFGKSEENILPKLNEGDVLNLERLDPLQHFTQPPSRFSEATLVKELEKDGIGRPSTYASIISTIVDRGYVKIEHGRFYAERMGEIVTDRLRFSFEDLMDTSFTASMETFLDKIAQGKENWKKVLNHFFEGFDAELEKAQAPAKDGGMPENKPLEINMLCPQCGKYHMAVQSGKTGMFLTCLGYYDNNIAKEERCSKTLNLSPIDIGTLSKKDLTEEEEAAILRSRPRCPKCQSIMDGYIIDEKHKLYLCSLPNCDGYAFEEGDFSLEVDRGPEVVCEKCGHMMTLKEGRFGKYMACSNKDCGNTRKILKNGQVAPPREDPVDMPELLCKAQGAHYVLRDGAAGLFLAAHNFPKVRETRPPKVSELKRFRDRISPKFYYLADAPEFDQDGNETEVRFSRKMGKQYVMAVKDGKATGFTAFYNEDTKSWEIAEDKPKAKKTVAKRKKTS